MRLMELYEAVADERALAAEQDAAAWAEIDRVPYDPEAVQRVADAFARSTRAQVRAYRLTMAYVQGASR